MLGGDAVSSATYCSLHDPDFPLEQRGETNDDLNRISESSVQQASKSLPKRERNLLCSIAK